MPKEYRVDAFVRGNHTKQFFSSREQAERYGKRQNERGEIVFLLQRMPGTNLYDVVTIIQ